MRKAVIVALLVCALPLFATEPNPSKRQSELVDQLLTLVGTEKAAHAVVDYFVEDMYQREVAQANGDPAALEDAKIDAARTRELLAKINFTAIQREATAHMYAKYLTEADLEALVAFYKTPAAQKYAAALPEITREAMKAGEEKIGPKLMDVMQQVEHEREQRHPWKRTVGDLRTLATAVEAYAIDDNKYPQESELKKLLVPTFIKELPEKDGWGNAYFYMASADGAHYRIASAGSDGVFSWDTRNIGKEVKETKYSDDFAEDIIYQDGEFVQAPSTMKPKGRASAAPPGAAAVPAPRP